jgi:hypothetical protein
MSRSESKGGLCQCMATIMIFLFMPLVALWLFATTCIIDPLIYLYNEVRGSKDQSDQTRKTNDDQLKSDINSDTTKLLKIDVTSNSLVQV